jgi:PAS domain S-box-containing protein
MSHPSPVKILLVDDRPENLLALEAILEGHGYDLVRATSGEAALKQVLRNDFAVILLDVQMPGMNGFETAELIKSREKSRHVPIIFLTAISKDDAYVFAGYAAGAVDYLFKPFNPDILRSKVAVLVELWEKTQQVSRQAELLRQAEQREREREMAEIKQASSLRYRNLVEAIPQIVWTADPEGHFSRFNERWFEYTGLSEEDTVAGGWLGVLHPDERERDLAIWEGAIASQQPLAVESRMRRAIDGAYRWHLIRAVPEYGPQGQILGWIGTCTDIDDRIRAQMAQEQLMEKLRDRNTQVEAEVAERTAELESQKTFNELILHSAGEGIMGVDPQGVITLINPAAAAMLGYDRQALVGKPLHETLHHTDAEGHALAANDCPLIQAVREGQAYAATEEVFWRQDGTSFPVELLCNPIRGQAGMGAVVTFKDITERKQAEAELARRTAELETLNDQLRQADIYKDEFLSVISHELRTPLNFIMGFASILDDEVAGELSENQHDYLQRIMYGAERMLHLVDDLLDFAKMQAGKLVLMPHEVPYEPLVDEVIRTLTPLAAQKGITLASEVEVPQPPHLDDQRIGQVLTNLINNGIKFTGEGGRVSVCAWVEADRIVTEVTDTGKGIAPEDLPGLFVRFKQLDMSATREAGGTGLGLSITKALVEAHGGEIVACSEGRGHGTTFRFTLPLQAVIAPASNGQNAVVS